ncbi:Mor transcription activator family protein [Terrisporobacter petrolearius]|uniref:Mor transcription activator family protein n=1 Tax=Terrisporobacter petrolearius TaxID=1460447 RepID=UPI0022E31F35|nr:Mor transcription activator family protein [Terrisporobacter petrolearius]
MNILMEDIPYELHALAEIVGMKNFEEISKLYGGTTVYIPVHRKVVLGERNREIVRQYNGKNVDKLRVKYGITSQQIRKILNENGVLN